MNRELLEKLFQLQWLLRKKQMGSFARKGVVADTSKGQGRVIAILKLRDGLSAKELSYLLGVSISSVNETLSKLEAAEYVTRVTSDEDKRVMLVYLTDKGRAIKQEEKPEIEDIFSALSKEEKQQFSDLLDKLLEATKDSIGGDAEAWNKQMEEMKTRFKGFTDDIGQGVPFFGGRSFHFNFGKRQNEEPEEDHSADGAEGADGYETDVHEASGAEGRDEAMADDAASEQHQETTTEDIKENLKDIGDQALDLAQEALEKAQKAFEEAKKRFQK